MKVIHTSDWHLGRSLYGKKRYEEFSLFLDWLARTIEDEKIDALLVAGDIFDTSTPSNRAQELYYAFLARISNSCCRHIVIIAGNHDSPTFLDAPKTILRALNVSVVGSATEDPADEVIVLHDGDKPEAIICAVPYLRDRDLRVMEPGETIDDKNAKLLEGLKNHYGRVCAIAEDKQAAFKKEGFENIPIIAMGHLFTAGGKTVDGDGVRELYVGSLAHVGEEVFPSSIDYLALGHLHVPQIVGKTEHIRYSGSPIPMGFGEVGQDKKIVLLEFKESVPETREISVPLFQELISITGTHDEILKKIEDLKSKESSAWIEVEYTGSEIISNLREMIEECVEDSSLEVRRVKNRRVMDRVLNSIHDDENLRELNREDVFLRLLDSCNVPEYEREDLIFSYKEIITSLDESDHNAQ